MVLEILISKGNGLSIIPAINKISPKTKIIIFSQYEKSMYVRSAISSGATGYIVKSVSPKQLIHGIRAVHQGRIHIDVPMNGDASASDSKPFSQGP